MHWIASLCMFRELLNVEEQARSLAKDFEVRLLEIRNLFSFYEDSSRAFPVAIHHVSVLFKASLLHLQFKYYL